MSVTITINDRPLAVDKGITILQAARLNGIEIPTLCDYPGLPAHGSCRMCIVEVQGRPNTPTACTTPVEEGMVVHTHTPKVQALRAELLQMLLSEHPSGCLVCPEKSSCDECMITLRKAGVTTGCGSCPKDEQCELQAMVEKCGLERVGYPIRYRMLPVEKYDPFFDRDYNLCILCSRCIRVCHELHFANVLAYTERGTHTLVGPAFHRTHLAAGCAFCGACVDVCPTGALSEKTRKWDGKPEGEITSTCPLCSLGCQVRLLVKNGRVIGSLPDLASGPGSLCVKGRFGITELVNHPTRLKEPQKRVEQDFLGIPWEEAVRAAAEKLSACPPARFGMLISAGSTNEDLYVAQKFTREVMKSGNLAVPAQSLYGDGLPEVDRLLRMSQPLSILSEASTILCLGLDGKYAQSVVETRLHQAKNRGARIITVHSRPHSLSSCADEWLQPLPGQEAALIRKLAEVTASELPETGNRGTSGSETYGSAVTRAARLLKEAASLAILLGPDFLAHPDNCLLLQSVEALVRNTRARVSVLPEQGNLAGSLLVGSSSPSPSNWQDLDVLYLVGEDVPANVPGQPFILYQNIYPSATGRPADLILPAAAFTETEGSYVDYSGGVQEIHAAVQPPEAALPAWEILCRIARQLGASGFDYTSAAEIQAEIANQHKTFRPQARFDWSTVPHPAPAAQFPLLEPSPGDHIYLGFPLARYVEGLRALFPEEEISC